MSVRLESRARAGRRAALCRAALVFALLVPPVPGGSPATGAEERAEAEKPVPASSGEEKKKAGEGADAAGARPAVQAPPARTPPARPARGTASPAAPTPAATRSAPAPAAAATPGTPAAPGSAAAPAAAPLSFTDDDLRKFHGGKPAADETGSDTVTQSGAAADAPPLLQSKAVAGRRPPGKPAATPEDPLKKYHDQEQTEKLRGEQVAKLREQIAQTQARIEALKQTRAAILDPYRIMPKPDGAEEAREEAKLKPQELLARVDEEIAKATSDLEELQQGLAKVESRFPGEQGP